jgi:hypothetical protein
MFSFNHCVISRLGNQTNTLLLVDWAKIQYTRDDEPTIFCINQDKNIDNEVYYVSIEFLNHLSLLTIVQTMPTLLTTLTGSLERMV